MGATRLDCPMGILLRGDRLVDISLLQGRSTYFIPRVVILVDCELDAFHADLQDAGGRRVVLHRHPPVGGNLESK